MIQDTHSDLKYSSIGRRFLALMIDSFILGTVGMLFAQFIPIFGAFIIFFLYAPLLESSKLRATIGKNILGIQVNGLDGERITIQESFLRNVLKLISASFFGIGFLFPFFTQRKQAFHDLFAGTVVVYGRSDFPLGQAWSESARETVQKIRNEVSDPSAITKLERLQALREKGAITEQEFQDQKRKFLS